jgi:hypothetical protein
MAQPHPLSGQQLVALNAKVCKFFTASDWTIVATLLENDDAVHGRGRLLRSLNFGDDDYESEALIALKKLTARPGDLQIFLNYVEDKYPSDSGTAIGHSISSHQEPRRQVVFCPLVFEVPTKSPDPNLVSVMMPFDAAFDPVYATIAAAAETVGLKCKRADDMWESSTVIQDVFALIYDSFVVVCDFTGKNPNVFYEAGIAHTLGKHVVPITQDMADIPFDLRHHRHARYLRNGEGLAKLRESLISRFRTLRPMDNSTVQADEELPF